MASKHREERIVAAVACPLCEGKIGEPCVTDAASSERTLRAHQERRWAWEAQRGPVAPIAAATLCTCGHSASHHGSERAGQSGCDRCKCAGTREQVRADA